MTDENAMTRNQALDAAQSSFFSAEQSARRAMDALNGRDQTRYELAAALESLSYGLKILTSTLVRDND